MVKKEGEKGEAKECEMPAAESEEEEEESVGSVQIIVQKLDSIDVTMRVKKNVKLGKVMVVYCNRMGLRMDALRFTIDGKRVNEQQTPNDVGLEDGDVIDVWSEQLGAGRNGGAGSTPAAGHLKFF
ncbi:OLC1v1003855C1 [Oldenlandia corymbosa var. corymbosa]|uniref:OLC1v1003855C1 n=1 Tax=Oldenlandia corymbosa var. corymbosa TaxID=529605 RepID=A0AAV1DDA9_OLDCO|nr:OLC1v1003855C1 [Oldenlandia corymbosa var. corymbosa]